MSNNSEKFTFYIYNTANKNVDIDILLNQDGISEETKTKIKACYDIDI
jgi:hypothetical protein